MVKKISEKIRSLAYSFQNWTHIEEILIKLNIWFFFAKNDKLLKKYHEIWERVSDSIKKEFNSTPVSNKKLKKPK